MRRFGLDDILTVTTGILMSRRNMDGLYDILGYMVNDPHITTMGLPPASEVCAPELIRQHPQLSGLTPPNIMVRGEEALWEWLNIQENTFGINLPVKPLPRGSWRSIT